MSKEFYGELIEYIKENKPSKEDLAKHKIKLCKKHGQKQIPTDIQILLHANKNDNLTLVTKPTRTISGVTVVAIMSHPFECPHGKCAMCPSNVESGVPMSYTGHEPATMRGIRNDFDSYLQVFNRLEQYIVLGQSFDKIELIIMGGTFPSFPKDYQELFVTNAFKAMNDFSDKFFDNEIFLVDKFKEFFELPFDVRTETEESKKRAKRIKEKILKLKNKPALTLKEEQERNELSNIKCVGLTVETRPDYGMLKEGNELLRLGCTRIELGIQSVYEEALKEIDRGHTVKDSIKSIKTLRNLGFKLNFHYMPGLPGIDYKKDLEGMKELFINSNFRPDMIKIYPCMVIPGTKLFDKFEKGEFNPITTTESAKLIAEFKPFIEPYCRVMRIQRDIPTYKTAAGVDKTNLRQEIDKLKPNCKCIRCREVGHLARKGLVPEKIEIKVQKYEANEGEEFFISAEDFEKNVLIGYCRLRFPSETLRKEIINTSAIVRELHVYGGAVKIGEKKEGEVQHSGWGKKLLAKAEEISKENKKDKILVISGVGVREYYRKQGYSLEGHYMVKNI
ncbi:tRNA uridine(34) 5-carboxymethylaminomethyl modification radical SAM/GNAT enzyme Elp3 [Candidatus Woesearchaeota archaeon]|nr:MAG: tRNA uridine(34) 5-carboxymethylaminomethyl modification radical SAM/GNAT enzyme Elp3 [Candidatus Woesearchaeota archaeon]